MKIIVIRWKDGSETSMVVHEDTDVLVAYKPVLPHIKWIYETIEDTGVARLIHKDDENEI